MNQAFPSIITNSFPIPHAVCKTTTVTVVHLQYSDSCLPRLCNLQGVSLLCIEIPVSVVGASSGIGRGTAIHIASLGARLVISGRSTESLQVSNICDRIQHRSLLYPAHIILQQDKSTIFEVNVCCLDKHFSSISRYLRRPEILTT